MNKIKAAILFVFIVVPLLGISQDKHESGIQVYVKRGLNYALSLKPYNPKDLIIVKQLGDKNFYLVNERTEDQLETFKMVPPDLRETIDNEVYISQDSVISVLWVKNKKYQCLNLIPEELPFKGLKSSFPNDTFNVLSPPVEKIMAAQARDRYYARIDSLYPGIKKVKVKRDDKSPAFPDEVMKDLNGYSVELSYPEEAARNQICGIVKVAYVLKTDGRLEEVYVLRGLGYGCDKSALYTLTKLSEKLQENGYEGEEDIYVETNATFTLIIYR